MARAAARRSLWLALAALPLLYVAAVFAAEPLFASRTPVMPVDVIVVLGGDGPARAAKATSVYHSIATSNPQVLISGDGDCIHIARMLIEGGVPAASITIECASGSTWENAQFSKPLLTEMKARTGILVTGWFHARRALGCFRAVVPEIRWGSAPVEPKGPVWEIAWDIEGREAAKEYLKIAWYAVRHGLLTSLFQAPGLGR